jgi:hypothetical protein
MEPDSQPFDQFGGGHDGEAAPDGPSQAPSVDWVANLNEELFVEEIRIDEVSIDGMCGVY